MKKVFSKKFLVPLMAMLLCVAVAFGTVAIASAKNSEEDFVIDVNPTNTVKKYNGSSEESIFAGLGMNEWDMALGPDAIVNAGMSDAYFEINAQRIIKIKPKMVRFMICPYYLCYMDDDDGGEARWTNGELNFNSAFMYNFWRYLEVFQAAGTAVELNWGYMNMKPMAYWFGIKDVPAGSNDIQAFGMSKRSAPRDLQAFANNFVKLLDECAKRGFIVKGDRNASTIKYVGFYNEVSNTGSEFSAFGDKRIYWCKMLEYVHNALKDAGYRYDKERRSDNIIAIVGTEHGVSPTINTVVTQFNDYVYDNAYKNGYCDVMNYHQYLNWSKDPASNFARGTKYTESTSWCNDRWKMEGNGTYGTLIAEMGPTESSATYTATVGNKTDYSGIATPFDGTAISIAIGASLGGSHSAMNWFCHDSYFVRSANFRNSSVLHGWAYPSMTGKTQGTKALGLEGVNSTFGEQIFTRYVPAYSKVAKSTVSQGNSNRVRLATYMTEEDTAVVAEFDYYGGMNADGSTPNFVYNSYKDGKTTYNPRTVRINLGKANEGAYKAGKTYYKYVHEYPESSFVDTDESQKMFDGNAILPNGTKVTVKQDASGYYIEDTISANHCLVIYSTMEPAKQIALADKSREIQYSLANNKTTGVQIKVDTDACVGLAEDADFEFEVFRGMVDGYSSGETGYPNNYLESTALKDAYLKTDCYEYKDLRKNVTLNKRMGTVKEISTGDDAGISATYTCDAKAKVGDTIAVRVKIAGDKSLETLGTVNNTDKKLQVYDTDVYVIAIIKIVA